MIPWRSKWFRAYSFLAESYSLNIRWRHLLSLQFCALHYRKCVGAIIKISEQITNCQINHISWRDDRPVIAYWIVRGVPRRFPVHLPSLF